MVFCKDKMVHFLIVPINNCTCNTQYTGIIRMNFISTIKYIEQVTTSIVIGLLN